MIHQIPAKSNALQFYSNVFQKLNAEADKMDDSLLDSLQDSTDVYVSGETFSREDDGVTSNVNKDLRRSDGMLRYEEREQKLMFEPVTGVSEQTERSVTFFKTGEESYQISHLANLQGANWEFSPSNGTITKL